MLDEPADEALHRAEQHRVDHHRSLALSVVVDVRHIEALWQVVVELDRAPLPLAPDGVDEHERQLRTVERATAHVELGIEALGPGRTAEDVLRVIPERVRAEPLLRPRRKLDAEVVADRVEHLDLEVDARFDLGLELRASAEDVRVVLGDAANAQHAVQRAAALVAVYGAYLGDPQRQLAVAAQACLEDLDVTWAVHRLHREAVVQLDRADHVL